MPVEANDKYKYVEIETYSVLLHKSVDDCFILVAVSCFCQATELLVTFLGVHAFQRTEQQLQGAKYCQPVAV